MRVFTVVVTSADGRELPLQFNIACSERAANTLLDQMVTIVEHLDHCAQFIGGSVDVKHCYAEVCCNAEKD